MAAELAKKIFEGGPSPGADTKKIAYGTAGFRTKAELLDHVSYRVGALAALRSGLLGKAVGVMVTASHNPEPDNGSKIVDPDGGMLAHEWEGFASELANAKTAAEIEAVLVQMFKDGAVPSLGGAKVLLGQDTRKSSQHLTALVAKGVEVAGGSVVDLGLCTTPQVHWSVLKLNTGEGWSMDLYYKAHAEALKSLLAPNPPSLPALTVDCGNGIGAASVRGVQPHLKATGVELPLSVINGGDGDGGLNHECGAEHVQKTRTAPKGVDLGAAEREGTLFSSFDGDADRVVMFYAAEGALQLLDGDKILGLLCGWVTSTLKEADLDLSIGIVQTAYANGASTQYLKQTVLAKEGRWKGELAMVATGVKHLHHKALDYDIGAYFEANGHGTIIFSDSCRAKIAAAAAAPSAPLAAKRLLAFSQLINPAVGDALSDMLAVHAVLALEGSSFASWNTLYQDLPSTMTKVMVKDRSLIKTTADEQQVTSPAELQPLVDAAVAQVAGARSFVRPSGTEDCVRVYAEAPSLDAAQALAAAVGAEVTKLLG